MIKVKDKNKYIFILVGASVLLFYGSMTYAQQTGRYPIKFRPGSNLLYDRYDSNTIEMVAVSRLVADYEDVILTGNGHIRLVAPVGGGHKEDPFAINFAALRATVIRTYLKQNFRMLTNWSFTFYIDTTRTYSNTVEVAYIPHAIPADVSSVIHYTNATGNLPEVKSALSKYEKLPYLGDAPVLKSDTAVLARFDAINALATNPIDAVPVEGKPNPQKQLIAIHYRWDKDKLDSLYLSNPGNLHLLDSILHSENSKYIDTLTIVAYASPEGHPDYNKRLSERRAKTIKDYITNRYEAIIPEQVITQARGANWDGLRNFVMNDSALPSRKKVLEIIDSGLPGAQKQSRLTKLDGGKTYYRYILPNYYRYLRNGASVLITYRSGLLLPLLPMAVRQPELEAGLTVPGLKPLERKPIAKYPAALKSNLLYDAVGAFNIGVEVPIGDHFSVAGDFAYAYWRSPKNLYALQLLEGGIEGRYWFGVSEKKKLKNPEWAKPLRGWNAGIYGMYCSRYDVQWIDGHQGDGFWSVGLAAGYAMPIARSLALEFALAAGYFYTPEYRHYHEPEYDINGNYRLMWQETGSFGTFTLTRARLNLVWLIGTRQKGGQKK